MTMTPARPAAVSTSTRERIIQVAIDLFAREGYGGTSLRNIAEQLGVTKAAVYHHFHTKDDIARVVLGRALDVLAAMTDRLIVAGADPAAWQRAILVNQRQLLFVLERNENTFRTRFADDCAYRHPSRKAGTGGQPPPRSAPVMRREGQGDVSLPYPPLSASRRTVRRWACLPGRPGRQGPRAARGRGRRAWS